MDMSLVDKIIPSPADNTYRGHPIAYYLFMLISIMTVIRSLIHILAPDGGAQSIASVNLNVEAGDSIVSMFAFWGLSQLMMGIVFLIVIFRYRSLIPLMWLFIFVEYVGRFLIGHWKPLATERIPPGAYVNYIIPFLAITMFVQSISEYK